MKQNPDKGVEILHRIPSGAKKQPPILSQLSYFTVKLEVKFIAHSEA